jgi:cytoskeletal protein CcmA (bactofilin family)
MALFGKQTPSSKLGAEQRAAVAPRPPAAVPPRVSAPVPAPDKEKPMEQTAAPKTAIGDPMMARRRTVEEVSPTTNSGARSGNETVISGDTFIEGKILAKGELVIDGGFKGEIVSSSRVIVGTAGKVEGTVEAKAMVVSGRVVGNLHILERLELLSTGELYGDLLTQPGALIIEKGARLEGRCSMGLSPDNARGAKTAQVPAAQPPAGPGSAR